MTGREPGNTYARMTFLRLTKEGSEHAKETVTNCNSFKIQGSRGPNHRISESLNLLNPTEEEAEEDYAEGLGFTAFTVDLRVDFRGVCAQAISYFKSPNL